MTPAQFATAYRPEALILAGRTGLDPDLFLVQWAVETGWGSAWAGAPYNLGNIECGPGVFCKYVSLSDFCDAETIVLHQPNMAIILNSVHESVYGQMIALGQSPWDAGHYADIGAGPGSKLIRYWEELRMDVLQAIFKMLGGDPTANFLGWSRQVTADLAELKTDVAALKTDVDSLKTIGVSIDLGPVLTKLDNAGKALSS